MKKTMIFLIGIFLSISLFGQNDSTFHSGKITVVENGSDGYGKKLMERLEYLNDVKEIIWIEIESNIIYIGFDPVPDDWQLIINYVGLWGNAKIGFGCHVWAIHTRQKGWRPGNSAYLGQITARHGKIE